MNKLLIVSLALFALPIVAGTPARETRDIVDVTMDAGSFKTLAAALQAADLVKTLQSAGPFTVFAPTDEAFAKLPASTLQKLLLPENKDKLQAVLTYHVVAGKVPASKVIKMTTATTVNGAELPISSHGKSVVVGGANVLRTDVPASNGIIHVIDAVMLPPGFSL